MGGLLSLEMAHQIALAAREAKSRETGESSESSGTSTPKTPIFRVLGMIFIDSIFPLRLAELVGPLPEEPIILSGEHSRTMKLKDKVDLNMTHARMMVRFWQVPRWRWRDEAVPVPPTILMRAKEFVNRNPADDQSFVDYTRDLRLLGWDDYDEEHGHFIRDLWEVNGHHFSIFDHKYVSNFFSTPSSPVSAWCGCGWLTCVTPGPSSTMSRRRSAKQPTSWTRLNSDELVEIYVDRFAAIFLVLWLRRLGYLDIRL